MAELFKRTNLNALSEEEHAIDEEMLLRWLDARANKLGEYRLHGKKILLNSPWCSDFKHHLALIPERGYYGRFRDWKSGRNGSLVDFVMEIDKLDFGDARDILVPKSNQRRVTNEPKEPPLIPEIAQTDWKISIPDDAILIERRHADVEGAIGKAARQLLRRLIDPGRVEVYYCVSNRQMADGRWQNLKNRLLFPYRDEFGKLYYWTARAVNSWDEPRYLEPPESDGAAPKERVLYVPEWNIRNRLALVVEGPIDCISVRSAKVPCFATQGSVIYKPQIEMLRSMGVVPIWAFDPDLAGMKATVQSWEYWRGESYFVFTPPKKDWNDLFVQAGGRVDAIKQHIMKNVTSLDERAIFHLRRQIACLKEKKEQRHQAPAWAASISPQRKKF